MERLRPAAVSPLRMLGGRRGTSCCRRHQPEVLRQLRQMHLLPAARTGKRSRSAAPSVAREESDASPLQECWAPDLSTASASTEAPRLNESTRVHHGSSRAAPRNAEDRHSKSHVFLSKIDCMSDPSDKLDHLQHKLLDLRQRVLLSMYRRQRRRAVSEAPRGQQLADQHRELASDSGSPAPVTATQRAASEYLHQLSHMLANSAHRDEAKTRDTSRGRHRQRAHSPPTKDPSACVRRSSRHQPAAVSAPGSQMERFARNESKLVELQSYLGGIRHHLQRMASELDSPPVRPE
ncbi:uncharacterized protein LOC119106024 [Pollicipes pollicipes]|uniref:uncharacterized protein LOC119106024 n=1 Tax=Pollicipes pollicipes TaxID=41117 RepID=UPI001885834A|nr:uncharacterized protein LOC119106024 [Pollicipes pollicipes]